MDGKCDTNELLYEFSMKERMEPMGEVFWGQFHAIRKRKETNYKFVFAWKDPLMNQDWDHCQDI